MLKVDNITKYYDDFCAVDHLSFEVKPGEIFGLLGVNGAGKTTTFRMIIGLLEPTSGEITLDGKKIDYSVTDTIGFLTEERSLLTKLTVREQCQYYGVLKGMKEKEIGEPENMRKIERFVLLKVIDQKWMDHIDNMEQMKQGIQTKTEMEQKQTKHLAKIQILHGEYLD